MSSQAYQPGSHPVYANSVPRGAYAKPRGRGRGTYASLKWTPPVNADTPPKTADTIMTDPTTASQQQPAQQAAVIPNVNAKLLAEKLAKAKAIAALKNAKAAPQPNSVQIEIGGAIFVRDPSGKKLVRKDVVHTENTVALAQGPSAVSPSLDATPRKASVDGTTYIRTKSGNLVSFAALKKHRESKAKLLIQQRAARALASSNAMKNRYAPPAGGGHQARSRVLPSRPRIQKINEQCRFFAKTGSCRNGLTCPYDHDPKAVSICPRFMASKCKHTSTSCPLSHVPSAHNMSHCVHYPQCSRPTCPYTHVKVSPSASICKLFSDMGWCKKGLICSERHVRECKEFTEKGTCSTMGCRLPHVIARGGKSNGGEENGMTEFVDPGTPEEGEISEDGGEKRVSEDKPDFFIIDSVGSKSIMHDNDEHDLTLRLKSRPHLDGDDIQANVDFIGLDSIDYDEEGNDEDDEEEGDDDMSVDSEELDGSGGALSDDDEDEGVEAQLLGSRFHR